MPRDIRKPGTIGYSVDLMVDETPRTLVEITALVRRHNGFFIARAEVLKALTRGVQAGTVAKSPEGLYHEPNDALSSSNFRGVPTRQGGLEW